MPRCKFFQGIKLAWSFYKLNLIQWVYYTYYSSKTRSLTWVNVGKILAGSRESCFQRFEFWCNDLIFFHRKMLTSLSYHYIHASQNETPCCMGQNPMFPFSFQDIGKPSDLLSLCARPCSLSKPSALWSTLQQSKEVVNIVAIAS